MFGTEWMIEEEFEPVEPWTQFEARWFQSIREAMQKVKDGKELDSRGDKEAWSPKKRTRRKERERHSRKEAKSSS